MTSEFHDKKVKQKTVMLVEDQEYSMIVLKKMLERSGINVIPAESGQEAVNILLENKHIDLIMLDIKMPVMDGYVTLKELRKILPEIKIIAETAQALPGDRRKILDSGFDDYLPKPITKVNLKEILDKHLQ